MLAMRSGLRSVGVDASNKLAVTDPKADSAQLMLTANTVTTYGTGFLDLRRDGPTVIEAPPNSLSFVDDAWQRYVADMGLAGPDKGAGGKYLFLPPGYEGEVPDGYFVARSPTYSNWIVIRALGGIESLETTRIYPLARADSPPEMEFINIARVAFNGTHSNDFSFYEEINTIVQEEPSEALDPERAGQIASIGIVKGQPFAPDERLHDILDTGARVAAGIARTLLYKPRDPRAYYYPDGSWKNAFVGGSYEFLTEDGARLLDMRAMMHYVGTGITPAMTQAHVGVGSQYAFTAEDATGAWLDGGNHYTLRLPAGIPAKTFWSIDIYDTQTRALLQTDNPWPSINSLGDETPATEADGDTVIHFAPTKPDGDEINWLQTDPGEGLVHDPPPLRATRTLVRQDLETRRDRTPRDLTRSRPTAAAAAHAGSSRTTSLGRLSSRSPRKRG